MTVLYGVKRPRWYVRLRGWWWLRRGYCPSCYSSPPLAECEVCQGDREYGPILREAKRDLWRERFEASL